MKILDWFMPKREFGLVDNPEQDNDPRNVLYSEIALGLGAFEAEEELGAPTLPKEFRLERPTMVLNQGSIPACVAHAGAHVVAQMSGKIVSPRDGWQRMKKQPEYPSSQLTYGAYLVDIAKVLAKYGMTPLDLLPNTPVNDGAKYLDFFRTEQMELAAAENRIGGYAFLFSGADNLQRFEDIKNYIWREKRSVLFACQWRTSYNLARKNGIVKAELPTGNATGHAMCVDGWKTIDSHEYIDLTNSWGGSWGDKGRIYLPKGFTKITGAIGLTPLIVQPPTKPTVRDKAREQANAMDMRQWLYVNYPERKDAMGRVIFTTREDVRFGKIRGLAGTHWPLLVNAVTYFGWTHQDVYDWLEANVDGQKNLKKFSYDFTRQKPM